MDSTKKKLVLPPIPMASVAGPLAMPKAYLSGSKFQICQDSRITDNDVGGPQKSIFKQDYPPWLVTSKPESSTPPKPAQVLSRDARYFNQRISETHQVFHTHDADKPELVADHTKLRGTNFKMDSDLAHFNLYNTTHSLDYPAKHSNPPKKRGGIEEPMKSSLPNGDRDKIGEPLSDYNEKYKGHDALSTKPARAPCAHQVGDPTIKGDTRELQFGTTHMDQFRGLSLPRVQPIPPPTGTNVPRGDRNKHQRAITVMNESYGPHDSSILKGYNKRAVMAELSRTNFKEKDGTGKWERSDMQDCFTPKHSDTVKFVPAKHRNHSDFPEGDDNTIRNADRANTTTTSYYHGKPIRMKKPTIVLGANLRTKSNVQFGEPPQMSDFYETSTDVVFKPKNVPYAYKRYDLNTRSSIPVNYYAGHINDSTYKDDFENPRQDRMIPNPQALENLKQSHVQMPIHGDRWFSTEHVDQYQPKSTAREAIDPGRLQRSSLPIGTLGE